MPLKCDICLNNVPKGKGYALTTTQVVNNPAYWEYAFTHQWAYMRKPVKMLGETIGPSEVLPGVVQQVSSSNTPWLVCETCIKLFNVDNEKCATLAARFSKEMPNGWKQNTGSASYGKALAVATEVLQSVSEGKRVSKQTRITAKNNQKNQRKSGKVLASSSDTVAKTGRKASSSNKKIGRVKTSKCDFCGTVVGEHEEIALLNKRVVELTRRAGILKKVSSPSFVDASGQMRWVACSRCKEKVENHIKLAQTESKKKWWRFWK